MQGTDLPWRLPVRPHALLRP